MADKCESGSLEIEQFVHFYQMLTQRDEVWKVFQDYSGDGERLTLEELESFLRLEQGEGDQSSQHAQQLIQRYEPSETGSWMHENHPFTSGVIHTFTGSCSQVVLPVRRLFIQQKRFSWT